MLLIFLHVALLAIASTSAFGERNDLMTTADNGRVLEEHRYLRDSKVTKSRVDNEERAVTPQFAQVTHGLFFQFLAAIGRPVAKPVKWLGRLTGKGLDVLRRLFATLLRRHHHSTA
ncbi:secreted RxLR effector peptide protein, putative [Phytophthora infestans T30-4]|uniref:Secreted RxLR effector peptide protein, putative n=2 Tax=Phytophthora infestans TaxID=4787 RepID=D0N906_PHYIT|nr:secreted RxLR effector peptide protein, putative [Phytophthora infestans T30-4]EEY54041.1 secreted RxLR effector peptide protein, putative [Phytophthora infestans T30-4]|eukprot:XP_002904672.1 secreted RxLR effector peptide protein, putative [Phytophthora infestans T30-4]